MIQALHSGALGMQANQKLVDTIANNIANINTTGYVKSRTLFKDALYNNMVNPSNPGSGENLKQGTGVLIGSITKVYSPSAYEETDNNLDFSIIGEGFFAVLNEKGNINFTRDGSFKVSVEDGGNFIVTAKGEYVLDENMEKISFIDEDFRVATDGGLYFGEDEEPLQKIAVLSFGNKMGLEELGNNLYGVTESSGEAMLLSNPNIKNKMIEGSNVNLVDEISQLIKAQRAYQMASKAVQTADDMENLANSLRA